MIFYLADAVLVAALMMAGLRIVSMHRALEQLRVYHQDCQAALEKTASALTAVRAVLSERNADGYELSIRLASLIAEARTTMDELDTRMPQADLLPAVVRESHSIPVEEKEIEKLVTMPAVVSTSHAAFAFCRRVARPMVEALADA